MPVCNGLSRGRSFKLRAPLLRQPLAIYTRRNFGRLDLAAPAPKHVGVRNRDIAHAQVLIDRSLMIEQQSLICAVRYSHDIDVLEFGAGFAPVALRSNVMPPDLTSGLNFAARRHCPVKKSVESCDTYAAHGWFDMFEES